MTAEAIALLVAIALPIISLIVVAALVVGIRSLERTRDELIELRITGK